MKIEQVKKFFDIILHKGQIYALDLNGAIWWISLPEPNLFQYRPSTPLDDYDIDTRKDKRLVEFCGDLYVIHHFKKTITFKIYKMDEELVSWVEIYSLGDKALIVASDSCFTVSASDYYGCLENAIYCNDGDYVSVFKLDDGSIITKTPDSSSSHQSYFQMFASANFLFTKKCSMISKGTVEI